MKNISKSFVLLGLLAFLAGCSGRAAIEKPSFMGYKTKVSFDEFSTKTAALYASNPILNLKEGDKLPSFKQEGNNAMHIEESLSRKGDGKEITFSELTSDMSTVISAQYDSGAKAYSYSGTQRSSNNISYYNKERAVEAVETKVSDFNIETDDENVVIYNDNSQLMTKTEATKDEINENVANVAIASLFVDSRLPNVAKWDTFDDEIKARYTFYVDKTVITVSYQYSVNYEVLNEETQLVSEKTAIYVNRLMQLNITETEVKYVDYIRYLHYTENYSYHDSFITIDIEDYSEIKATESIIVLKDDVIVDNSDPSNYEEGHDSLAGLYFVTLA